MSYCNRMEKTMPTTEQQLGALLLARHLTISTAESCTGGRLAAMLNKWPGSSEFYNGSIVAYSNDVKMRLLGVPAEVLNTVGAVSEETVRQMVRGVRDAMHTDCAIATSGIAGPGGATPGKPVGTVWIAWLTPDTTEARCFHFHGSRDEVTTQATQTALEEMVKILNTH